MRNNWHPDLWGRRNGGPTAATAATTTAATTTTTTLSRRPADILGRLSADIIKSGGFKLSALDIERVLLEHPDIAECAVLGVADPVYGEKVAMVVVLRAGSALLASVRASSSGSAAGDAASPAISPRATTEEHALLASVRAWGKERLAAYKLPSVARVLAEMPRNAMGKVNKKELRKALFG